MISEDISNGEELVKVPVVNELSDKRPTSFGVTRFSWCCITLFLHIEVGLRKKRIGYQAFF